MTADWFAGIASILALIVTVVGWFVTYSKQKQLANLKGDIQKFVLN